MDREKVILFLKELNELAERHGITIGGCGCCDSPFLSTTENGYICGSLTWDKETKKYAMYSHEEKYEIENDDY